MAIPSDALTADAVAAVTDLLNWRGQPIALIPATGTVTEKPGGGSDYTTAAARDPQVFAKFNTRGFDGREDSSADQGLSRKYQFDLIGYAGSVVQIGDSWEDDAAKFVVESVDNTQPYQVKAIVTAWLKVAGHGFG